MLATLVLGTAVSTWQAIRATAARAEADDLRQEAVEFAEHLKQANVLLDNARANADGKRWATAYQQHTQAAELQPDHYRVWSGRASLFVRLGLWKRAAADYAKALELGAPANNPGWWGVPQLCLYAGDTKACRDASTQMLEQFAESSDSLFKIVAIRGCLVDTHHDADPEKLVRLAESMLFESQRGPFGLKTFGIRPLGRPGGRPLGRNPEPRIGREAGPPPRREFGGPPGAGALREVPFYVAGLAQYRAGRMEEAIECLRESVRPVPHWPTQGLAYPVLAMAYHRAGRIDDALMELTRTEKTFDQWLDATLVGSVGAIPVPWFDFIEYLLLYREASALITGSKLEDDPRLNAIEQRALDAIEPQ